MSRSPSSVSHGSTPLDRPGVRRDQLGEAAGRDHARASAPSSLADRGRRCRPPGPRSRRRAPTAAPLAVVLADHCRRLDEVDLDQPRRPREERLHRDLDPGREHAADVLARRRDDVEVRRGAEVDDDARRPVALLRGDRVRDPVGPDLARVVVADRDPGRDARPEHEQRRLRPALGDALVLADELRHRRRRGRCRRLRRGRGTGAGARPSSSPVRWASVAIRQCSPSSAPSKSPKTVCVFPTSTASSIAARAYRSGPSSSSRRNGSPIRSASASAVSVGSSPSPRSSSTVTSLEV